MCEAVGKGTCAPRPDACESMNVSIAHSRKTRDAGATRFPFLYGSGASPERALARPGPMRARPRAVGKGTCVAHAAPADAPRKD